MEKLREALIHEINSYQARYHEETSTVRRFLDLLQNYPTCFQRHLFEPGHITASAWLVNRKETHVMLTHHRKLNKWLQLGGHTDGNENTRESAKREAIEESGIHQIRPIGQGILDLDIHVIPAHAKEPQHEHFDLRYAFICEGDEMFTVSDESHDLKWVAIHEIRQYSNEHSMLRMAEKWLKLSNA